MPKRPKRVRRGDKRNMSLQKTFTVPRSCTPRKIQKFLEALEDVPNVNLAAAKAGFKGDRDLYRLKNNAPRFSAAWDHAMRKAVGKWEAKAARRAFDGVGEPVFQMGRKVGETTRYSDILAIRMLEAHHPMYSKKLEVFGKNGNPIALTFAELAKKSAMTIEEASEIDEDEMEDGASAEALAEITEMRG